MFPEYPNSAPVPCKDQYETSPLTQERALGDVVESRAAVSPRFHADRVVKLNTAPPLFRREPDDARHYTNDEHDGDDDHDDRSSPPFEDCQSFIGEGRDAGEYALESRDDERLAKRQLLERDRLERRASRERARRERLERRAQRSAQSLLRRRRPPTRRPRDLGRRLERTGDRHARVLRSDDSDRVAVRDRRERAVSGVDHRNDPQSFTDVAADARSLKRPLSARVHGIALVLYFLLLPYVVLSKWRHAVGEGHATLVRILLVVLAIFWVGFLCQVVRNVTQLRRGARLGAR